MVFAKLDRHLIIIPLLKGVVEVGREDRGEWACLASLAQEAPASYLP